MRAIDISIGVGADVKFDSDHGTQLGKVADIKSDVTNGRRVAAVHVAGTLDGQPWHVPVDQLQPVVASA
jgi:hypothetical protein